MTVAPTAQPRLEVGGVVSRTFSLAAGQALLLFPVAAVSQALSRVVGWLVFATNPLLFMPAPVRNATWHPLDQLKPVSDQFIQGIFGVAMAWIAYTALSGIKVSPREAIAAWSRALVPIAVTQLAICALALVEIPITYGLTVHPSGWTIAASLLGSLAWLIAFVYLALGWWVAGPVVIVESRGPIDALRRSFELTRGYRWALFGIGFVVTAATVVPMWALWLLNGTGIPPRTALPLWSAAGAASLLLQIALSVLMAVAAAVAYSDLRRFKEGAPAQADVFA
jgi:hypothetical protein